MLRDKKVGMRVLCREHMAEPINTADEVMNQFKILWSHTTIKKTDEELLISHLKTAMMMMEGNMLYSVQVRMKS